MKNHCIYLFIYFIMSDLISLFINFQVYDILQKRKNTFILEE